MSLGRSPVAAVDSTTFKCWEHGGLISRWEEEEPPAKIVSHQCGFRGCRIGEASNPGPVQTRQARRQHADIVRATQIDVSPEEEVIIRPNCGRDVIGERRTECIKQQLSTTGHDGSPCRGSIAQGHSGRSVSSAPVLDRRNVGARNRADILPDAGQDGPQVVRAMFEVCRQRKFSRSRRMHLRTCEDYAHIDTVELLLEAVASLARASFPTEVSGALMSARLTALSEPDGRVRGIATGELTETIGREGFGAAVHEGV